MIEKSNQPLKKLLEDKEYFLSETAELTITGAYSGNLKTGEGYIDDIGRNILDIPKNYNLDIHSALSFFADRKKAVELFYSCINGGSFVLDIEMKDYHGNVFWAKASGKPLHDSEHNIVGVRGVFTSIDRFVRRGNELENRAKLIQEQNDRLVHFAHIVSHNLRSHASNLQLTLDAFNDIRDKGQQTDIFFNYLTEISNNLSSTLEHLNQVVTINIEEKKVQQVNLETIFKECLLEFKEELLAIDAKVKSDFTDLSVINYVPSFLKNIFIQLISNSIKFRSRKESLRIKVRTKVKNKRKLLVFKDNGVGIDMNKQADYIFKMFESTDASGESQGIGLFVLKNQVESLGGDVMVKSKLKKGTSFTIKF